jgi:hypothetical protein
VLKTIPWMVFATLRSKPTTSRLIREEKIPLEAWKLISHLNHQGFNIVTIDSQPLKVENRPDFLKCRWRVTYYWKALDEGYNFALDLTSIRGLHTKLRASKVARDPISRILGIQLGNLGTKWHLGVGPVARHKEYYKGEGGGFPQVQAMVSLMNLCLHVICPCMKNVPIMH